MTSLRADRNRLRTGACLLGLIGLSAALHFFKLSEPSSVVFDEVYFGGFANGYLSGEYFFDVHPPHAKLLITSVAAALGYEGTQDFARIHQTFAESHTAALRVVPALAGTLIPALVFLLLIELGAAPAAGGLAAFALMFDNGLLVQTRIVALDGVLVAATLGALILILRALRSRGRPRRSMLALGAGALVGLAAGTKVTGLLAGGLAALCVVAEMRRQPTASRSRDALSIAVWTLSGAVFVYLLGWYLHFVLLPLPGPGDIWGPPSGRFVHDLVMLHRQMMSAQVELARVHAYSSPWWGWPWMSRPVLYWSQQGSVMYFVGNPVVWWGSSLLLMALFVTTILGRLGLTSLPVDSDDRPRRLWIPLTAWLLAWSPLAAIPRILFLYHYLTPMVFAVCSVTLWADRLGFTRPGSWRQQRAGYDVALGLILLGFILASPFSFSFVEAQTWTRTVFGWLTEWR